MTKRDRFACVVATVMVLVAAGSAVTVHAGRPVILRGVVVDQDGNPLVGATIEAVAEGSDIVVSVESRKKGRFSIRVANHDLVYEFSFSKEGFLPATVSLQPLPDQIRPLTVTLVKEVVEAPVAPEPEAESPGTESVEGEAALPEVDEARVAAIASYNDGVASLQAGDKPSAMAAFRAANEADPEFPDAYKAMAAIAMELGDFQTAADAAEALIELEPENAYAITTAYSAEYMLSDVERLGVAARRLAEARPEVVASEMLEHARVLFGNDELDASRVLLGAILGKHPELAAGHLQLGLTCNMMGDVECAKAALTTALELEPDGPDAETAKSLLDYLE